MKHKNKINISKKEFNILKNMDLLWEIFPHIGSDIYEDNLCVICGERIADAGANCDYCLDGIKKAQRNKSGRSKYFAYIHSEWQYLPKYKKEKIK